jgi:hypothetical protein
LLHLALHLLPLLLVLVLVLQLLVLLLMPRQLQWQRWWLEVVQMKKQRQRTAWQETRKTRLQRGHLGRTLGS